MGLTRRPYKRIEKRICQYTDRAGGYFIVIEGPNGPGGPYVPQHKIDLPLGTRQGEALTARDNFLDQLRAGTYSREMFERQRVPSLAEWIRREHALKESRWAPGTHRNMDWCASFLSRTLGDVRLDQVNPIVLETWWSETQAALKPRTANQLRRHLSGLFERAIDLGYIDRNPGRTLRPVRSTTKTELVLPDLAWLEAVFSELRRRDLGALRTTDKRPFYMGWEVVFRLQFACCARISEMLSLRNSDIDFTRRIIRIRAETTRARYERAAPVTEEMLELVIAHRARQLTHGPVAVRELLGESKDPALFPNRFGRVAATSARVQETFTKAQAAVGTLRLTTHKLRYLGISALKRAGVREEVVRQIAGHQTHEIHAHYSRPFEGELEALSPALYRPAPPSRSPADSPEQVYGFGDKRGTDDNTGSHDEGENNE